MDRFAKTNLNKNLNKLKVGFIVDGHYLNFQNKAILDYVIENDLFQSPIVFQVIKNYKKKTIFNILRFCLNGKYLTIFLIKIITCIENLHARKKFKNFFLNFSLNNYCNLKFISLNSKKSLSNYYLNFSPDEIKKITSEGVDVLIRFNSGILKGEILNCTKYGILSFHRGDNRINRGGPSGFWEVFNNEESTGFVLQKLNEELDGGDIIYRGSIPTKETWTTNKLSIISKSNFALKKILNYIAKNHSLPPSEEVFLHYKKLYKIDNPVIPLIYILKILCPSIITYFYFRFAPMRKTNWSVAYSKYDGFKTSLFRYKEITNPPNRFLADPFIYSKDNRSIIFVEDYSFKKSKGDISAIELSKGNEKHLGIVLSEEFHLSFPFIFEYKNELYMVPETGSIMEIRLYKCIKFPTEWKFYKTIMKNVSAADNMIIFQNDKWFLFSNICSANTNDHDSELHIFYADNPISNKWIPLKCGNPVLFDPQKSRNGGFITNDGELYRINQIYKNKKYGHSFGINLIEKINENEYSERRISNISPDFKDKIKKTHHFHSNKFFTVIDFCRLI